MPDLTLLFYCKYWKHKRIFEFREVACQRTESTIRASIIKVCFESIQVILRKEILSHFTWLANDSRIAAIIFAFKWMFRTTLRNFIFSHKLFQKDVATNKIFFLKMVFTLLNSKKKEPRFFSIFLSFLTQKSFNWYL